MHQTQTVNPMIMLQSHS